MNKFLGCLLLIAYRKNNVKYDFDNVFVLNNKLINKYIVNSFEKENNIKIKECKCFVNKLYGEESNKRLSFVIETEEKDIYLICDNNIIKYESRC